MKKINKKTKSKLINIAALVFSIFMYIIFALSIFFKEYAVCIIILLLQIYAYLVKLELTFKMTIEIPNNEPIEIKKKVKKGK